MNIIVREKIAILMIYFQLIQVYDHLFIVKIALNINTIDKF